MSDREVCEHKYQPPCEECDAVIHHALTDQPVCPWCAAKEIIPMDWEWHDDCAETRCLACERVYVIAREVRTTYTTSKL